MINAKLQIIDEKDRLITFKYIRSMIINIVMFNDIEYNLYAAFRAPEDDIFY